MTNTQQSNDGNNGAYTRAAAQSILKGFADSGGYVGQFLVGTISALIFAAIIYGFYSLLYDITNGLYPLRIKIELVALTIAKAVCYVSMGTLTFISALLVMPQVPYINKMVFEAHRSKEYRGLLISLYGSLMFPATTIIMALIFLYLVSAMDMQYSFVRQTEDGKLHLEQTDEQIKMNESIQKAWAKSDAKTGESTK